MPNQKKQPNLNTQQSNVNKRYVGILFFPVINNKNLNKHTTHRGKDSLSKFTDDLKSHIEHILNTKQVHPTEEVTESFNKQKRCGVCNSNFMVTLIK